MAKIKVTPELMADVLFPDCKVEIVGASFIDGRFVELEIKGPDVPDVPTVIAFITKQPPVTVRFEPWPD